MSNYQDLLYFLSNNEVAIILYSIYVLVLKGIALWKSARNSHKYWFIAILIINLFGIPELLYIFYFSKKQVSLSIFKKSKKKSSK